jgi:hypothetical protein
VLGPPQPEWHLAVCWQLLKGRECSKGSFCQQCADPLQISQHGTAHTMTSMLSCFGLSSTAIMWANTHRCACVAAALHALQRMCQQLLQPCVRQPVVLLHQLLVWRWLTPPCRQEHMHACE